MDNEFKQKPETWKIPNQSGELKVDQIVNLRHNITEQRINPKINLIPQKPTISNKLNLTNRQKKALDRLKKIRSHKHWHNAKIIIVTILVFLLVFNSQWVISQFIFLFNRPSQQAINETGQQIIPLQVQTPAQQGVQQAQIVGPENEIIIPKINVKAPLVFINTTNESEVLTALRDGVVHYYGTAYPGENGNTVFFGHSSNDWWEPGNYKFVFVLLERLVPGDIYEIHYNSRRYIYTVIETKVVAPNDLSVLNQTTEPISTLITCTPPGTSWKRFIVVAKQTEPVVTSSQIAQSQTQQTSAAMEADKTTVLPSAPPTVLDQIFNFLQNLFRQEKPSTQSPKQHQQQYLPEVN